MTNYLQRISERIHEERSSSLTLPTSERLDQANLPKENAWGTFDVMEYPAPGAPSGITAIATASAEAKSADGASPLPDRNHHRDFPAPDDQEVKEITLASSGFFKGDLTDTADQQPAEKTPAGTISLAGKTLIPPVNQNGKKNSLPAENEKTKTTLVEPLIGDHLHQTKSTDDQLAVPADQASPERKQPVTTLEPEIKYRQQKENANQESGLKERATLNPSIGASFPPPLKPAIPENKLVIGKITVEVTNPPQPPVKTNEPPPSRSVAAETTNRKIVNNNKLSFGLGQL